MSKIGFIGTGVMGSALIKGIINKAAVDNTDIMIYDKLKERADDIAAKYHIRAAKDLSELCQNSDYIFLCVKPIAFDPLLKELKKSIKPDTVLVSIAAGVTIKKIKSYFDSYNVVIRTMPNTPALVNEGMTIVCVDDTKDQTIIDFVESIFSSVGEVETLSESLMSEVISLTSSSPAYVYMFIDALSKSAVSLGIPKEIAVKLAARSVFGSAKMVLESSDTPEKLKNDVCSLGGTTIEAVRSLEKSDFYSIISEAMRACTKRAYELGKE